jgi:hypothetical protein
MGRPPGQPLTLKEAKARLRAIAHQTSAMHRSFTPLLESFLAGMRAGRGGWPHRTRVHSGPVRRRR